MTFWSSFTNNTASKTEKKVDNYKVIFIGNVAAAKLH